MKANVLLLFSQQQTSAAGLSPTVSGLSPAVLHRRLLSDHMILFQVKNVQLSFSTMHDGSESQSQQKITSM